MSRAPVAAAMSCASANGSARRAMPPSTSMQGSPLRSAAAASSTAAGATALRPTTGSGSATMPPSFQQVSEGRISVAIWPGAVRAACTATAASAPTASAVRAVRTHADIGRATPSVSVVSGGSSGWWCVAWSPTRLTIGEAARLALCRQAKPLARPGPQCSSVAAGRPVIRA